MRTIFVLDEETGIRHIQDIDDANAFSAYAFVISSSLLPVIIAFLSNALGKHVTRQTLAADLNTFMAAIGLDRTFAEGGALAVNVPVRELTRYFMSVDNTAARLRTISAQQNTISVSSAPSCQFSIADWEQFVVGILGGGSEAVAMAAIANALGVPIEDERA